MTPPTDEELLAYADELLVPEVAAQVENQLRTQPALREHLHQLLAARDQGNLSIGDLWRHHRLSCPTRTQLGLHFVNALHGDLANYITFHINEVGCVYCQAELDEMQESLHDANQSHSEQQRRDFLFASSAGLLKKQDS